MGSGLVFRILRRGLQYWMVFIYADDYKLCLLVPQSVEGIIMIPVEEITRLSDGGSTINIEIDGNTSILCTSSPGADINKAMWKICKVIRTQDTNFGGYPYMRTLWAVNPDTGYSTNDAVLIANIATTGYVFR